MIKDITQDAIHRMDQAVAHTRKTNTYPTQQLKTD